MEQQTNLKCNNLGEEFSRLQLSNTPNNEDNSNTTPQDATLNAAPNATPGATSINSGNAEPQAPGTNTFPIKEFPLFVNLAKELQDLIWKHASESPRIIKVEATTPDIRFTVQYILAFKSNYTPSGLLTACRDSRAAMLKIPHISIKLEDHSTNGLDIKWTHNTGRPTIQLNPDRDVILFWSDVNSSGKWLSPLLVNPNPDRDYDQPHAVATSFVGVKNIAFCLPATTFLGWPRFMDFPWFISQIDSVERLYVIPTHPVDKSVDETARRSSHPILSGRDLTLQYEFEDLASKARALKLSDVEMERFDTMLKKRMVRWKEEKSSWKVPESIVAVVRET
ncbi:hypothetical protein ONS95_002727 [Cadophora gregata]|uniref:uncharacterized protein n=1 Tax=Cadophora gregata TaxID=51156 RepID=UPI0026DB8C1D|nr:uncharacterized protein ONS95_002727 [Cadophora gregata]KAK0110070.1 hypothetical protein ONS95_002727 [Cadophora gregata]KAK0110310.1 hypothetical protein ONS96_001928 [Cadophora gregata f. sp. sojae]